MKLDIILLYHKWHMHKIGGVWFPNSVSGIRFRKAVTTVYKKSWQNGNRCKTETEFSFSMMVMPCFSPSGCCELPYLVFLCIHESCILYVLLTEFPGWHSTFMACNGFKYRAHQSMSALDCCNKHRQHDSVTPVLYLIVLSASFMLNRINQVLFPSNRVATVQASNWFGWVT